MQNVLVEALIVVVAALSNPRIVVMEYRNHKSGIMMFLRNQIQWYDNAVLLFFADRHPCRVVKPEEYGLVTCFDGDVVVDAK